MHVNMRHWEALGGQTGGGVVMHRFVREQQSAGMNGQVRRHVMQYLRIAKNQLAQAIRVIACLVGLLQQGFNLCFGEAKDLAQFPNHGVVLKGAVRTQ